MLGPRASCTVSPPPAGASPGWSRMTRVSPLDPGGTLDVFLANHALERGYRVTLLTYNLELFDPTWFALRAEDIRARLRAQAAVKKGARLQVATSGYDEFLRLGGTLELRDLE